MKLHRTALAFLAAVISAGLTACPKPETKVYLQNPTDPGLPTCTAPTTNNAAVIAQAPGSCSAAGPCIANYSVSSSAAKRTAWSFPGAQPSEAESFSGVIAYKAPGIYVWSNILCTSTAADDPMNACCRQTTNTVTFVEGG
jgi:hypothetical protein